MAEKRLSLLREVFRPWYFKVAAAIASCIAAIGAYAGLQDQFPDSFPRLQEMTPGLHFGGMPWWGWTLAALIVLLAIFVYGLFEYVRQNLPIRAQASMLTAQQTQQINIDLAHLLYFALREATLGTIDKLIAAAPTADIPLDGTADQREDAQELHERFVRQVNATFGLDVGDGPEFRGELVQAERSADLDLTELLSGKPELGKIVMKLRLALVAQKQRDVALRFLTRKRAMLIEEIAGERNNFADRYQSRSKP